MSTVENAANQAIQEFVETLSLCGPGEGEEATRFAATLNEFAIDLERVMRDRLGWIFVGGSSRLICEMPNNRHSFSGNRKHCSNCGADFCTNHALTKCLKCNHTL